MPFPVLILSGFLVIWIIYIFNRFISLTNRVKEAWADVDAQLKRRYDLINNLTEVVKAYAKHEKKTFAEMSLSRVKMINTQSVAEKEQLDNQITSTLRSILAIAENYPKLRAAENYLTLQQELTETENLIEKARRYYNGTVRELNIKRESFPYNMVAIVFGVKPWPFFQVEHESERAAVHVS